MKLLLLITFSLLSLPLAQAGMELSTPQTDWMQAGRIERREITKKRYHQRAGVSQSQIVFNYDGSITFVNPKLIRGPKAMPIDSAYSNSTGICRLFGLDNYLDDSKEETFVSAQSVATINVDGTYYNQDVRSHAVKSISCTYQDRQFQAGAFKDVFENADGTITLIEPQVLRGNLALPIDSAYSNSSGICRLFGLDNYLDDSKEETFVPAQSVATINVDGTYYNQDVRSHAVKSISCYMQGDLQQVGFAKKMTRNLDNSVTIYNAMLVRGIDALPIDSAYSNPGGICRLFGFSSYLDDSKEEAFVSAQSVATINVDGTYYNQDVRSHAVGAITCYSGRYRTTAIAGGVLFQDGKWLGKIRKVKSRWGNTQAHNVTIATPENGGAHVLR